MSPGVQGTEGESRDCLNPLRSGCKTVVAGRLFHTTIALGKNERLIIICSGMDLSVGEEVHVTSESGGSLDI